MMYLILPRCNPTVGGPGGTGSSGVAGAVAFGGKAGFRRFLPLDFLLTLAALYRPPRERDPSTLQGLS